MEKMALSVVSRRKDLEIHKGICQLRSSLFPYIYSFAHQAAKTGVSVVRPLPLEFEGSTKFDNSTNMYMLGSSLLVGAFDMNL